MFDKKKINFWRLVFIFGALTLLILMALWKSPIEPKSKMMDKSIGNMMAGMHTSNITIYDLFGKASENTQMSEMHSHHQGQSEVIYKLNYYTTGIIFLLLPFIIGGAIILAIIWVK